MADETTQADDKVTEDTKPEFKLDRSDDGYKDVLHAILMGMAVAGRGSWERQALEAIEGADAVAKVLFDKDHEDDGKEDADKDAKDVPTTSPQVPPPQQQPIPPAQNPGKPTPAAPESVDADGNPLPPPAPEGTVDDQGRPLPQDGKDGADKGDAKPADPHTDAQGNPDKDAPAADKLPDDKGFPVPDKAPADKPAQPAKTEPAKL